MKRLNLLGEKFGRLLVVQRKENGIKPSGQMYVKYLCECVCGRSTIVRSGNLRSGQAKSCGCLRSEITKKRSTKHGLAVRGKKLPKIYNAFTGILSRCKSHPHYGERGIKCLWNSFEEFRDDMQESYLEHVKEFGVRNTSIDRIDVNGNYCKENCRWATWKMQQNNKRNNHLLTFNGETKTITEWEQFLGFGRTVIWQRISNLGWDTERALSTPQKYHAHS